MGESPSLLFSREIFFSIPMFQQSWLHGPRPLDRALDPRALSFDETLNRLLRHGQPRAHTNAPTWIDADPYRPLSATTLEFEVDVIHPFKFFFVIHCIGKNTMTASEIITANDTMGTESANPVIE